MKKIQAILLVIALTIFGCSSSKPTSNVLNTEPTWFKVSNEKISDYYVQLHSPTPDSLKQKTLTISLKNGISEKIDISDILDLAYQSKRIKSKDAPLLSDAISTAIQGIQSGKNNVTEKEFVSLLSTKFQWVVKSLSLKTDSLTRVIHEKVQQLDIDYRDKLNPTIASETNSIILFAGNYEKMKLLIGIEQELTLESLREYQQASDRLKLLGESGEESLIQREKFLRDCRALLANRSIQFETAIAQFKQYLKSEPSKIWYQEAKNHYETLFRLSNENLNQLNQIEPL